MTTQYATQEEKFGGWENCKTEAELEEWRKSLTPEDHAEMDRRCRISLGTEGVAEQVERSLKARFWWQGIIGFGIWSLLIWGGTYLMFAPAPAGVVLKFNLERPSTIYDTFQHFVALMVVFGPLYWLYFTSCWMSNCASKITEKPTDNPHPLMMLLFAAFVLFFTFKAAALTNGRLLDGEIRDTVTRAAELGMYITTEDIESERSNNGGLYSYWITATLIVLGGLVASVARQSSTPVIVTSVYVFVCALFECSFCGLAAPLLVIPFLMYLGWSGMGVLSKAIVARL
jgi:hypothetical protein